jgi:hypothetical protein
MPSLIAQIPAQHTGVTIIILHVYRNEENVNAMEKRKSERESERTQPYD